MQLKTKWSRNRATIVMQVWYHTVVAFPLIIEDATDNATVCQVAICFSYGSCRF